MALLLLRCTKCGSDKYCKNGMVKGEQRYRCAVPTCRYNFTGKLREPSKEVQDRLFDLHFLDGLSNKAIANELGVSDVTISKWLKKYHL
jgi:transposase-like protein